MITRLQAKQLRGIRFDLEPSELHNKCSGIRVMGVMIPSHKLIPANGFAIRIYKIPLQSSIRQNMETESYWSLHNTCLRHRYLGGTIGYLEKTTFIFQKNHEGAPPEHTGFLILSSLILARKNSFS